MADDHPAGDLIRCCGVVAVYGRVDLTGVYIPEDTREDSEGLVAGKLRDGLIESGDRCDEAKRIVLCGAFGVVECDEGLEMAGSGQADRLPGRRGFDHRPNLFEMLQRGGAQLQQQRHVPAYRLESGSAYDGPPASPAPDLDELLRLQYPQRLAQGLARDL